MMAFANAPCLVSTIAVIIALFLVGGLAAFRNTNSERFKGGCRVAILALSLVTMCHFLSALNDWRTTGSDGAFLLDHWCDGVALMLLCVLYEYCRKSHKGSGRRKAQCES